MISARRRRPRQVSDNDVRALQQTNLTSRCFNEVILPSGNIALNDGTASTGVQNYKEFWYTVVGLAGEAQNFDGNGSYMRSSAGGGDVTRLKSGKLSGRPTEPRRLYGNALAPAEAARDPRRPASKPAADTSPTSPVTSSRSLTSTGPPPRQATPDQVDERREARDPEAHARLHRDHRAVVVLALGVTGYILAHQRFYLPNWVPVLGTDFFELKGEFSTAQSVTPGQGQTVDIAGVPVGEIKKRRAGPGRAVVTMEIRQKYKLIKSDATMLLRPKTGLKDMIVELDPGTPGAPAAPDGFTVPVDRRGPTSTSTRSSVARPRHARLPAAAARRAPARASRTTAGQLVGAR